MAETEAFLVEIGTEELPPRSLAKLALAFLEQFNALAVSAALQTPDVASANEVFFSPRRLAIHAANLRLRQPDREEQRLGPAVTAAFDAHGQPSKAAEGFARSCGVGVDKLQRVAGEKGERLAYRSKTRGRLASELLPQIVSEALAKLPVARRMRWGAGDVQFVRPVHWLVMLLGTRVIKSEILGVRATRNTFGHRFHHPGAIALEDADAYRQALAITGKVLVEDRAGTLAKRIAALVAHAAKRAHGKADLPAELVREIAALVEWPVPVLGSFDPEFLALPNEVIKAVLESQQRYFPLRDTGSKLMPKFIAISNIRSRKPADVRRGNERVIRPRLSDAMFFWNQDRNTRLAARIPELERVVYQKDLGSYGDKSRRIAKLASRIAAAAGGDTALAERAALLCKCDLVTGLVGEFPELQGIMGGYYARADGEPEAVARAIGEHYRPAHAGDALPQGRVGQAVAIADKLDTLAGAFAIGHKPSGDKDPFGLRRAALGVMRTLVECELDLDLVELIKVALAGIPKAATSNGAQDELYAFMLERLRAYYLESGIRPDVFEAVHARRPRRPLDFHRRVQAVNSFLDLPEARSLAAANKRIGNILRQAGGHASRQVEAGRLQDDVERSLYARSREMQEQLRTVLARGDYTVALKNLAALRAPVDEFFERVLVMDPDAEIRNNRLALLETVADLFLQTADLALIQTD